ncbi:hypothetical protein MTO96_033265 [Rhipicephalus appendiculatus]
MSSEQGSQGAFVDEATYLDVPCLGATDTCSVTVETSEEVAPSTSTTAFDCDMCSSSFSTYDFLMRHRRYGHSRRGQKGKQNGEDDNREKPPFICDVCNRSFARKNARTSHVRIHARTGYECADCGRRFSNSSHLSRHRRCHLEDSEWFVCPECWAGFARKDVMQRHMLSHTGERPYACRVCGDVFTQRVSARRHEKNSHGVE